MTGSNVTRSLLSIQLFQRRLQSVKEIAPNGTGVPPVDGEY
jgi:hypothetical protein